jgi:pSer/pThr/pTyr-binding forkhead associated (FHA) protein
MKLTLVRLDTSLSRDAIEIDNLPAVIGSSSDARIRLDDHGVCSFHCSISRQNDKLIVRDLGSRQGTFLNGYRVRESVLRHGDRVVVGGTQFRAQFPS